MSKTSTSVSKDQSKNHSKNLKRKTLVLLDSHAIIHRAYHALPDFASSKGVPTGALYGLTTMLLGIIEKFKPEYIVACYDLPQPTYRHLAYKDYKAGRKKTDDALVEQLQSSRKIFEAFGIPIFDHPGFEADDMLGTIVEQVAHDGKKFDPEGAPVKVVIASGDMDTMQLVTGDDVVVYTLKKGIKDIVIYDELAVIERFGFKPDFLPDYKGLRGDPSDNIIGIAGIGEKTASIIIGVFGTVEDMYAIYDKDQEEFRKKLKDAKITDRIIGLLENGRDDALFSKTLATIRRDAPITFNYEDAKWNPHLDQIETLFRELEFRSLIVKIKQLMAGAAAAGAIEGPAREAGTVDGASDKKAKKSKSKKELKDLDVDGGKDSGDADNAGKSSKSGGLFDESNSGYYQNTTQEMRDKLKLAVWVLDSNKTNPTLDDVYAETDELDADKAFEILWKKAHDQGLGFVLDKIEIPLIPIIHQMTKDGVMIDVEYLRNLSSEYHQTLSKIEKEIHEMAGIEFNIASPKQLGEVLYEKMQLGGAGSGMRIKKTAGGAKSTKESELEKMKDLHPIIGKILEYRELAKLLGTYIDVFPALADEQNRIHPNFSQTGAATGRMATYDPSIQNIPIKSELGKKIRNAFIAPKGKKLIAIDYSQIELRVAAILSADKNLVEIFKNHIDVHTGVAARVFKVAESEVTKDMRRQAKVINFGILYGMGVNALRQNLSQGGYNASREEAQNFYSEYFNTFTGIASYLENVKVSAAALGYTKTLFGRRRYFEGIKSHLPFIRAAAERMAINAPVQGTATADITKLAMLQVFEKVCQDPKNKIKLLMQIHDELVFEVDVAQAEKCAEKLKEIMENTLRESFIEYKNFESGQLGGSDKSDAGGVDDAEIPLREIEALVIQVPIEVSVSIGDSWGEMK